MICQDYELVLGDYVDGTLDDETRAIVEAHLSSCAPCRALVADLGAIRHAAATLEPAVPSPRVWTRLSAAIEADGGNTWARWGFTWHTLAASTVTVMLVASLSWVGARLAPVTQQAGRLASQDASSLRTAPIETDLDFVEAQFTTAIAGLETITKTDYSSLDSDTAGVLQANLTVIDGAINESRAALETDPDSAIALQSLFDALRSKVELLQDAVALINEMRKGNQEGAARIISELNQ